MVLVVISKRIWRGKEKPELGWSYFSTLHFVDTSWKFQLKILLSGNLKHKSYFSTILFKNLIFKKHRALLFCMMKILHFVSPAKFCIFHGDLVSRFQVKHFFFVVIYFRGRRQCFHWLHLSKSSLKCADHDNVHPTSFTLLGPKEKFYTGFVCKLWLFYGTICQSLDYTANLSLTTNGGTFSLCISINQVNMKL